MSIAPHVVDLTHVPPVSWAWVDEHVYAAIRGCSVKVLQRERRLNIGCAVRRINGTMIRYKLGDISAFLESQPGAVGPRSQTFHRGVCQAGRGDLRLDCSADASDQCDEVLGSERPTVNQQISVFKNGRFYHYEFKLDGRRHRGSTGTANKQQAINEERRQRERLQKTFSQIIEEEARQQQRKTIHQAADEFLQDYRAKHRSATFAEYALGHVASLLGDRLVVEITPKVVKRYQIDRLREAAGPKTISDEVLLLLRLCGDQGDLIRATLRRNKALKLRLPPSRGRPYSAEEKAQMLEEAQKLRTPQMRAALALDLNTGLRDKELREIRWEQIDLIHNKALTVGQSKSEAGTGRMIPLNDTATAALAAHASLVHATVWGVQAGVVRIRLR